MSNLIIMPGDVPELQPSSLVGHTLTLNFEKVNKYQTFKFFLSKARPFAQVPPDADLGDLATAILKGILIDVTDQHINGANLGEGSMSGVSVSDIPGKHKVFIGSEKHEGPVSACKQLFIAIPKDDEEERAFLNSVRETGRIDGLYQPVAPEVTFGPIQVLDIEERTPIKNQDSSCKLFKKAFAKLWWDIRYKTRKLFSRRR